MDKNIVLNRIEELMKEKGITKYQLRKNTEISSTIYQWKKNAKRDRDRTPSLRSIEKICNYFGISLSYFFAFEKQEESNLHKADICNSINLLNDNQIKILELIINEFLN